MFEGRNIADLARTRIGQKYVLGAKVHLANADWSGPWDCAEFISWACYHSYKQVVAVRPPNIQTGESYSGWWYEDGQKLGTLISVKKALGTLGAILVRRPGDFGIKIGHVAISLGDGSTVEAHSSKVGVAILPGAAKRSWTSGMTIPGVSYTTSPATISGQPPTNLIELKSPFMRGAAVIKVQNALKAAGVDPGPIDGVFGQATATAVAAFQAMCGIVVDGVVGPETRTELGI